MRWGRRGERRFGWDPRGFLASITTVSHDADRVTARTQRLCVDALGELSGVDGEPVLWDTAAALPALAQVGEVAVTGYGPLTGLLPAASPGAGEWVTPTWRPGSAGADPWAVAPGGCPYVRVKPLRLAGSGSWSWF